MVVTHHSLVLYVYFTLDSSCNTTLDFVSLPPSASEGVFFSARPLFTFTVRLLPNQKELPLSPFVAVDSRSPSWLPPRCPRARAAFMFRACVGRRPYADPVLGL